MSNSVVNLASWKTREDHLRLIVDESIDLINYYAHKKEMAIKTFGSKKNYYDFIDVIHEIDKALVKEKEAGKE